MQESGRNPIIYRKRRMLKQDKIQTFSAIEEPTPDWNDKPMYNGFNFTVFNKSKQFFSPSPRWTYAKIFSLCRFTVCQQLRRTKLKPELTMTSASPLFFFLFFFSRAPLQRPEWSKQSEREKGREAEAGKEKTNENSQTNRRMRKQGCLHKQKQCTTNLLLLFSLQSKISVRQTQHLNWRSLSLSLFQFQTPKLECII